MKKEAKAQKEQAKKEAKEKKDQVKKDIKDKGNKVKDTARNAKQAIDAEKQYWKDATK